MSVCYSFFSLAAIYRTKSYIFVSLFLQNIRRALLVYKKLELVMCLIISDVFLKFSPAFQNTKTAFHVIKYSSSAPVVKSRKELHANLLELALHRIFQKIWPQVQSSDFQKYILMAASENNCFLRTFLNDCFSRAAVKICSIHFNGLFIWGMLSHLDREIFQ